MSRRVFAVALAAIVPVVVGIDAPSEAVRGGDFQERAAINDPSGATQGSYETTGAVVGPRVYGGIAYQCPKYNSEPFSGDPSDTVSVLHDASLTVDSRANSSEYIAWGGASGFRSRGFPYWKNTGHDGVYTCNWPDAGGHRIVARGVYQFDQTAPAGYAQADAECATGYPRREVIPAYYRYYHDELEATGRTGAEWETVGAAWAPHRFEWMATTAVRDSFDLQLELGETPTWRPLYPRTDEPRCSDDGDRDGDGAADHVYVLDVDPATIAVEPVHLPQEPVNFRPGDFVSYAEWDNCGLMQVDIEQQGVALTVDQVRTAATTQAPPPQTPCEWWPPDSTLTVHMTDTATDTRSGAVGPAFLPWDSVVKRWQMTAADPPVPTRLTWTNTSQTVHSVTAAVDTSGASCADPSGSISPSSDQCDQEQRPHLFDSHPLCAPTATGTRSPLACMKPGESFSWTVPETPPASLCDGDYCTIPYYCRFSPDTMRGAVVGSL